ncbi:MAG: nuclear transport factor 2 family protein [Acidobacteria bacterium]|nr:MAG: nuclear transport factor 2 family protein [Acidobacteriota bacterium]REK02359.1 MAG: nuclear transport factor 2 family protein [Acidobacteriota bacterium]REK13839.1 MAG: nuclear transport factor 2 family protein [Acidobacteriota bacterium]REK41834.1 MAG: nuclear transport factor 2 family protein [Acidobacteriota bacterium]
MDAVALEQDGVRKTIDLYFEGIREGNVDTLKEAFHSTATMCGYFGEDLLTVPIEGLYEFVEGNPAPAVSGEPFEGSVATIDIAGTVASAKVIEKSYMGHNFTDFFNLLKIEGRWWIVSKVFNVDG